MRIVHVGLAESIHLARWVETLSELGWEQHLIPMTLTPPCPELRGVTIHMPGWYRPPDVYPGIEMVPAPTSMRGVLHPGVGDLPIPLGQAAAVSETIRLLAPDVVHAHGVQIAGYELMDAARAAYAPLPPWAVSCWGSDLYHFGRQPEHVGRIRAVLQAADGFVADSQRDIDLAHQLGLHGEAVHVASVSGGLDLAETARHRAPGLTSARRIIAVKGRHTWVYRGRVALKALARCGDLLDGYRVVLYGGGQGVRRAAEVVSRTRGVDISVLPRVPYDEILRTHGHARVSISLSVSDGTNVSFLEAITMGSFPIQSTSSATHEWAAHGESALFVDAEDVEGVAAAIRRALTDDQLVDRAAEINDRTVHERLDISRVRDQLGELYEGLAARRTARTTVQVGPARRGREPLPVGAPVGASEPAPRIRVSAGAVNGADAGAVTGTINGGGSMPGDDRVHRAEAVPLGGRGTSEQPLVSIITPAYNRATFIAETIDSIRAQDYPNLEHIVLDDGSTDDTLAVVQGYGDAVRWAHHPNMGQPRTVNRGFEMARGEILGVVNSDDPLLPGAISAIVEVFQQHPDVVVVYPDWLLTNEQGAILSRIRTLDYSYVDMVRLHHTYPGPCALFRRSVVERIGGYDPDLRCLPDYDFWLRAGLLGPFRRLQQTVATYRSHPTTITNAERGEAMAREHLAVMDKYFARTDLPPEVLAVRMEAYRNTYYVAAVICTRDVPPDERFHAYDRLGPRLYQNPNGDPLDDEGPSGDNVARMIETLHQEIAKRDEILAAIALETSTPLGRVKHALPPSWRFGARRLLGRFI